MAANVAEPNRLLSIQSHVVSGYVGNRSATFPMQLLGWEVDVINTVQFSNHTGFGRWGGTRFDAAHLDDIFSGLDKNGLLRYARVLTGYIPSPEALNSVQRSIQRLRELNPNLIYVLDPVMGDIGRGMYVNPDVVPIYRAMLPLSSIITPNQFEAQVLAEEEIVDLASLIDVITTLHDKGVEHVLITSVELPESDLKALHLTRTTSDGAPLMLLIGSTRPASSSSSSGGAAAAVRPWYVQFPEVEGYFSGVGDLFAAVLIARYLRPAEAQSASTSKFPSRTASPAPPHGAMSSKAMPDMLRTMSTDLDQLHSAPTPLSRAAELSISTVQAVLARTTLHIDQSPPMPTREEWEKCRPTAALDDDAAAPLTAEEREEKMEKAWQAQLKVENFRRRELKIVQSRVEIEQPVVRYRAKWLQP